MPRLNHRTGITEWKGCRFFRVLILYGLIHVEIFIVQNNNGCRRAGMISVSYGYNVYQVVREWQATMCINSVPLSSRVKYSLRFGGVDQYPLTSSA